MRGDRRIKLAIMVSGKGRGSNLQAIVDAISSGDLAAEVAIVVGVRPDAPALERAAAAGCPVEVVAPGPAETGAEAYGTELLRVFAAHQVELICLAGFMRLLPSAVVRAYRGRILNVHPALLPRFGGKGMFGHHVHDAVLVSGAHESGCTVHIVDDQYDTGPIVLQSEVPVLEGDSPETLAARILPLEHSTYVRAIQLFSENRVQVSGDQVTILPPLHEQDLGAFAPYDD